MVVNGQHVRKNANISHWKKDLVDIYLSLGAQHNLPNNPKETSKESKKNSSINEKAYRMLKEMHERFPDTVSEVMTLQKKTLFRKQMCTYD
jgi:hypothetical protein